MAAVLREISGLERVDGAARVALARRDGATRIADLYQRAPCRVLFPGPEAGDALTVALLTTSGGLTGGDRLSLDIRVEPDAAATITTQAAEKIYRSAGGRCDIGVKLEVGAGAWAEWLMQETILFDGARLSRRLTADVAPTGRLLAVESFVFGRAAMGEVFREGYVHDSWRVRRDGRLVWMDAVKLDGDVGAARQQPYGFGNAAGFATLLYAGADASRWLGVAREAIAGGDASGAATSFDGVMIVRLWAEDAARLRRGVGHCIVQLRSAIAGLPARLPKLWSI